VGGYEDTLMGREGRSDVDRWMRERSDPQDDGLGFRKNFQGTEISERLERWF
jgi:hypothetical protein